uniref:Vigilin n=2 Tax=Cacopsylla melanoneura TaxID=428564 RepID=A0A8D8Q697_9HEMI
MEAAGYEQEQVGAPPQVVPQPDAPVVSYDEMFPVLSGNLKGPAQNAPAQTNQWSNKMRVSTSSVTQVFSIPRDERKSDQADKFGEEKESMRRCAQIMSDTGVHIEIASSQDQSLTFLVTGKQDQVLDARRKILANFQTQSSKTLSIPKEHHKNILGKAGARLQELQKVTATKITIPNINDSSDEISIIGPKEGIEKAVHEIQMISDEQSKKAFEKISVPKKYHPFICGAHNCNIVDLQNKYNVRINVPPPSVDKDMITISGEKEGVLKSIEFAKSVHADMDANAKTVSIEVSKSQHKYIIGQKGNTIAEILATTGVSVEMPSTESNSETIVLRGPQASLGSALTMVYTKANSVQTAIIKAPAWIHKYIIGRKGENIRQITQNMEKSVHVEFVDDTIKIEGPKEEVDKVKASLEVKAKDLTAKLRFIEMPVDPKHYKHIIGKGGANVNKLKTETETVINITETAGKNIIRIEGNQQGVKQVEEELKRMINKLENEKEKDCIIDYKLHRQIIGPKGDSVRELQDKFGVQIAFPSSSEKSDVVKVRGLKENVDKCDKHLKKMLKEINENSFVLQVPINKQYHRFIIGKEGTIIKKIREDTGTKIELPPEEDNNNDTIIITGKKDSALEAKARIMKILDEVVNVSQEEVNIPYKYHNYLIGTKGKLIQSIKDECGGVNIKFPPQDSKSDKVIIRGAADDVAKAKALLLQYAEEREQSSFTAEIRTKVTHHRYLLSKGLGKLKKIRETGARIIFPSDQDEDRETITIIGKKEVVEEARKELERVIKDIDNLVEDFINIDPVYHRHYVAHRGEVLNQIIQECGDVSISFPKMGTNESRVVLKGEKAALEAAKARMEEIVQELKDRITSEVIIPQIHHRSIMMNYRSDLAHIRSHYNVLVRFPDRPQVEMNGGGEHGEEQNGDGEAVVRKEDIVMIEGSEKNVEKAKEALLDLIPSELKMEVPYEYHRTIIGVKGQKIRVLQDDHNVRIEVPRPEDRQDYIKIKGRKADLESTKEAITAIVAKLDEDKEDREKKSFQLKMEIDPIHHPKIIGRKGETVNSIRKHHDVQVNFPKRGDPDEHIITLVGYQESTEAARDEILSIVKNLESLYKDEVQIDARVHPRIIGGQGRSVRRIMEEYKVDIKFPRQNDPDPNLVIITGKEDDVLDAKDRLLNMEDEFLQDIEHRSEQEPPRSVSNNAATDNNAYANQNGNHNNDAAAAGFVVKGGPWEQKAPDTASTQDFPSIGGASSEISSNNVPWGPRR